MTSGSVGSVTVLRHRLLDAATLLQRAVPPSPSTPQEAAKHRSARTPMDLPKAASCSTLVALPIGHSPQAKSATIGSVDSSCRLLHVHIGRDGNVVLTGFSRVDGGGAPQATHFDTPFAIERGVLPKDAVPLLAALDMQSRLTTHALKLLSGRKPPPASRTSFGQSTTDRERSRAESGSTPKAPPFSPASGGRGNAELTRPRGSSEPHKLLQRGPPIQRRDSAGGPLRDLSQSETVTNSSTAMIEAGRLNEAAEKALPILPLLSSWRRQLLLSVISADDEASFELDGEGHTHYGDSGHNQHAFGAYVRDATDVADVRIAMDFASNSASTVTTGSGDASQTPSLKPGAISRDPSGSCIPRTGSFGGATASSSGPGHLQHSSGSVGGAASAGSVGGAVAAAAAAAASACARARATFTGSATPSVVSVASEAPPDPPSATPSLLLSSPPEASVSSEAAAEADAAAAAVAAERLEGELCNRMLHRMARRLSLQLNGAPRCRAVHCEANDEGGSMSELVIARRGKCVSVLRLSAVASDGIRCAVHLLGCKGPEAAAGRERHASLDEALEAAAEDEPQQGEDEEDDAAEEDDGSIASEADAAPPVAEALTALYYDAHVSMCKPSKTAITASVIASHVPVVESIWEDEPAVAASQSTSKSQRQQPRLRVDSVSSLRALLEVFPTPPPMARCLMLNGEAYGPTGASGAALTGYVHYLLHHTGGASSTSLGESAGGSGASLVTFLPCGGRGALGFVLPSPHEAYECVAWPHQNADDPPYQPSPGGRCRFDFLLLCTGIGGEGAATTTTAEDASRARDEARRLLERALGEQWEAFRCFRVWRQLKYGKGGHLSRRLVAPAVSELSTFVGGLPVAVELDEPFPSLRSLKQLRGLPWANLLSRLEQLPKLRSCRWHDSGTEHLLLLRPAAGGESSGGAAHDHLIHCELRGGSELRVRACSTRSISNVPNSLVSELSEGVANAIVCWTWTASMAMPAPLR